MHAKIEAERLYFLRNNQEKLRVEEYVHLRDAVQNDADMQGLGKLVILPSSFTGGPRYMQKRAQDAMTYVRMYGRPDLFITMTCNPEWKDITEALLEGQKATDRPGIVARVFHLKWKKMKELVVKGQIFGEVRCHIHSIEWQKRGLPHVHSLYWLSKKLNAKDIDSVIQAEIPSAADDPKLFNVVSKTMVHGPCGLYNPQSMCMKKGRCSKQFPKEFLSDTVTGEDSYPKYKRRSTMQGGHQFTKKIGGQDCVVDNRWIVPYNPVLSRTFEGHINVEYCNSVKSIKYICKYVCKGSDQMTFDVVNKYDEVANFQSGRYISSAEAVWRTLGFPIHDRFPPVQHLSVHLENGQRVYFKENTVPDLSLGPPATTLTAFFALCQHDDFGKTLLYHEVPTFYTFNGKKFLRRKRGKDVGDKQGVKSEHVIGRVYTVHPSNSECFHLRILLHEVRGATSFSALKTVNGQVHATFKSACIALGLLEDDAQWERTLDDSVLCDSPSKIRELFAILLVFCNVAEQLWVRYKEDMAADILRACRLTLYDNNIGFTDAMFNQCLCCIEDLVQGFGKEMTDFGLDKPIRSTAAHIPKDYLRETSYNAVVLDATVRNDEPLLTGEQNKVYSEVLGSVESIAGKSFFLDAPGGTGKIFLINLLLAKIRSQKKIALAVASTGIAATLLQGGRTAHSMFKLPLVVHDSHPVCNISRSSVMARIIKEAVLIVWDESTMAEINSIEALNNTLKDNRLMGGITVLFAGDFRQTLPVIPRGTRADEVRACIKSSHLWVKFKKLSLKTNMRVNLTGDRKAAEFAETLRTVGNGTGGVMELKIQLCKRVASVQELINTIYPDVKNISTKSISWLRERAILTPKNNSSSAINEEILGMFDAEAMTYSSVDTVSNHEDAVHYPTEFLNSLTPSGMPQHTITIKTGAPVMLMRNLNPPKLYKKMSHSAAIFSQSNLRVQR